MVFGGLRMAARLRKVVSQRFRVIRLRGLNHLGQPAVPISTAWRRQVGVDGLLHQLMGKGKSRGVFALACLVVMVGVLSPSSKQRADARAMLQVMGSCCRCATGRPTGVRVLWVK